MASDPAVFVETRSWLHKASEDVRAAEVARAAEPPLGDAAVFHCQQAAEKAIKGFLTLHARPFRKTHSIEEIGELAVAIDLSLRPVIDRAAPLAEYAWKFRYPGIPDEPAPDEVDQAIAVEWVPHVGDFGVWPDPDRVDEATRKHEGACSSHAVSFSP